MTDDLVGGAAANGEATDGAQPDLSLAHRLRQPRTIISLVLPIVLLVLFVRSLPGFKLEELPDKILGANPWLLIAAFVVFYLGFPLRGLRWAILVRQSGYNLGLRDSTEIIFLSWLVNCLVPAKLGDVYRAYLLKINSPVSLSRTFGTVFIERVLDLFTIVVLGLAAGFVSFMLGRAVVLGAARGRAVAWMRPRASSLQALRAFAERHAPELVAFQP